MAARQGISFKRTARNKNRKSKYIYTTKKVIGQTARNGKINKKYAYTKRILVNGKYRYYYS